VCGFVQRSAARAASSAARGALAGVEPDGSCRPRHTVVAIVSVLDGSAGVQRPTFSSTAARSRRLTRGARDADGVHRSSLAAELRGRCAGNGDLPRQTPSWPWRTCTRPGRGRFRISRRARTYAAEQSRARGGEGPPADCAGTRGAWRRHHHDPLRRQVIIAAPDLPIRTSWTPGTRRRVPVCATVSCEVVTVLGRLPTPERAIGRGKRRGTPTHACNARRAVRARASPALCVVMGARSVRGRRCADQHSGAEHR
jgi:hypothetical protein